MNKKLTIRLWPMIGLIFLTLGCQLFSNFNLGSAPDLRLPTPRSWPHSTFVPPRKVIQVPLGQELQIESHHISTSRLETIQIFVNGQELISESTSGQTDTFPNHLATVQVLSPNGLERAGILTPEFPTANQTVILVWTGQYPGVYELSMVATDKSGRTGNTIIQQIEVK